MKTLANPILAGGKITFDIVDDTWSSLQGQRHTIGEGSPPNRRFIRNIQNVSNGVQISRPGAKAGITQAALIAAAILMENTLSYTPVFTVNLPLGSKSVAAGTPVSYTVVINTELPVTYDWRLNGVSIGASSLPNYTIGGAGSGDAGTYTCVVTNAVGSVVSNPSTLVVT